MEFAEFSRTQLEDWRGPIPLMAIEIAIRNAFPEAVSTDIRRKALDLVRTMIIDHGLLAGRYKRVGSGYVFAPWELPIKCTLDRIDYEWAALGRELLFGEVVWLTHHEPVAN